MERVQKAALVGKLIQRLSYHKSWCGETHIQKATYFVQELAKVPLGFNFILYRHGPYSFELTDELTSMRADEMIELRPHLGNRTQFVVTKQGEYIQSLCEKTLKKYDRQIEFVARTLGSKGVVELERLATALFVTLKDKTIHSVEERSQEITKLKPHIQLDDARTAINEQDSIAENARRIVSSL